MKYFVIALSFYLFSEAVIAQPAATILTGKKTDSIFTAAIKKQLNIQYPIFRVYSYTNKNDLYYTLLTESRDSIGKKKDTFSFKIKTVTVVQKKTGLQMVWDAADAVNKKKGEQAIWFWSRYSSIADVTGDGIADPVIVYGTAGQNHFEDGRVVIVTYYGSRKIYIRHQNGTLDNERRLTVDQEFYTLPATLQAAVIAEMKNMSKRMQALYPVNWENAMKAKKTVIKN